MLYLALVVSWWPKKRKGKAIDEKVSISTKDVGEGTGTGTGTLNSFWAKWR